jgi:peroxin-2
LDTGRTNFELHMSDSSRTVWQDAWDRAQPRLSAIRTSLSSAASASPRTLRVGQLDAELLDQELIHILEEPLNKALALVNVRHRYSRSNTAA